MNCLIIGGNRFVGMRLSLLLEKDEGVELSILNRTGQAPHCRRATIYKGDRRNLGSTHVERDWDVVVDFACYNENDAAGAVEYFKNVGRYIFISSAAIYDSGENLREEAFAAATFDLAPPAVSGGDRSAYRDGKRRCEAVFAQKAGFAALSVRPPFILGPDDYTNRLEFHVERVLRGEPLYFPNLKAAVSMVHAEDLAAFLHWAVTQKIAGAINVASPQAVAMSQLLAQIQLVTGREPVLAKKADADMQSPYAPEQSLTLNVERMQTAGFQTRAVLEWLPDLIGPPEPSGPRGMLH